MFFLTWMWVRLWNSDISNAEAIARIAFSFALFSLFILALVRFGAYYAARKLIRTKPSVLEPITYEISADGVAQTSSTGSAQSK